MALFSKNDIGNKRPVEILKLEPYKEEIFKKTYSGETLYNIDGTPEIARIVYKPVNYVIRILPHRTHDIQGYAFKQSITKHYEKEGSNSEIICTGKHSGCIYCDDIKYSTKTTHYMVVDLINTDGNKSAGIYVLEFNGWLENELRNFEIAQQESDNLDITSLLDDGCYLVIRADYEKGVGFKYHISKGPQDKCPYSKDIRNNNDISEFAGSFNIPDLYEYVDRLKQRGMLKAYTFQTPPLEDMKIIHAIDFKRVLDIDNDVNTMIDFINKSEDDIYKSETDNKTEKREENSYQEELDAFSLDSIVNNHLS